MQIILNEHVSVKKLLVLTFTDAAATEIKQKLFNQITEALKTVDQKDKEFLNSQLDLINSAEIGTLHSVCKKLIIKYFYEINESPDFRMLSDKESKFLLENSVSSVFEKHIADSDDRFFELYDSYNSKRNEVSFVLVHIQALYSFQITLFHINQSLRIEALYILV